MAMTGKGPLFANNPQTTNMEKRILGLFLSLLGVIGLIVGAFKFINTGHGTRSIKEVIIYLLLGVIFFFAGISLVRSTKDKAT
jgi:predicted Na+-dependent transporter